MTHSASGIFLARGPTARYPDRAMTMSVPATDSSAKLPPTIAETTIEDAWFDAPPPSSRSQPPPSVQEKLGEFVGDVVADSWFKA
jgi:hypothetical protein